MGNQKFFFQNFLCHLSQIDTFLCIFLSETVVASNQIDSIKISVCVYVCTLPIPLVEGEINEL